MSVEDEIWELDRRWSIRGSESEPSFYLTEELADRRCLVLLGAAGMGKTFEANRLARIDAEAGKSVQSCRLAEYSGSSADFSRYLSLLNDRVVPGSVIYLDALDEAMMPLPGASLTLRVWIEELLATTDAFIRITCRSAVWPERLTSVMLDSVGSDSFKIAQLQPLSTQDIGAAAVSAGLDSSAFIEAIEASRVASLATQPFVGAHDKT